MLLVGIPATVGADIRQTGYFDDDATVIPGLKVIDGTTPVLDLIGGDWPTADGSCGLGVVAADSANAEHFSDKML